MSDSGQLELRTWVEREFAMDGVLAAGGGERGGQVFGAFASGEFVLAHDPQVWQSVAENIDGLRAVNAPVGELFWGFERAILCTVEREDGAWLGVFTLPNLPDENAILLRGKLDAFKTQPFRKGATVT